MTEVVQWPENFPAEKVDEVEESLEGAIEVYKKANWTRGWGNGDTVCILNSVNMAVKGGPRYSVRAIPAGVIKSIHRALFPEQEGRTQSYEYCAGTTRKNALADEIIDWNDGYAKDKTEVVGVLKRALKLHRAERDRGSG